MANPITTGVHPKLLWPGIHAVWGQTYDEHKEEYTDLFDVQTSDKAYEEDVEVTGFGMLPVKSQGQGITFDTETQGAVTRYTHVAYALGYIVTYEELRDNQYKQVSERRAQALAFSGRQTLENTCANVYNRAFNSTYTFGDGVELISSSHPTLTGNQSNILTTASDLTEASIEDLGVQIMDGVNARGHKITIMPRALLVPTALWFESNRILNSVQQNDTANNAINVIKATNMFPEGVKVNHYFNSTTAWFIRTNVPRGMTFFWRDEPMFDKDNDFDTKNAKAAMYMRFSAGSTDFRGIYGTPGL
jgi:hypothetical protein